MLLRAENNISSVRASLMGDREGWGQASPLVTFITQCRFLALGHTIYIAKAEIIRLYESDRITCHLSYVRVADDPAAGRPVPDKLRC